MWVKFSNIPDSYWTKTTVSCLASSIGRPISADRLTEKLDILPFAKFRGEYKLGDPLSDTVKAEIMDRCSGYKSVVLVYIEYANISLYNYIVNVVPPWGILLPLAQKVILQH